MYKYVLFKELTQSITVLDTPLLVPPIFPSVSHVKGEVAPLAATLSDEGIAVVVVDGQGGTASPDVNVVFDGQDPGGA